MDAITCNCSVSRFQKSSKPFGQGVLKHQSKLLYTQCRNASVEQRLYCSLLPQPRELPWPSYFHPAIGILLSSEYSRYAFSRYPYTHESFLRQSMLLLSHKFILTFHLPPSIIQCKHASLRKTLKNRKISPSGAKWNFFLF